VAYFEDRTFEVPLPANFGGNGQRRARDMTWREILTQREELREERANLEVDIALQTSRLLMAGAPHDLPIHIANLKERRKFLEQQILFLDVELLMRPALSVGCLFFILVGCPVGIWFSRSDYLSSFITCFMPIILVYYPLTLCGTGMAKEGRINPFIMVWGADILIALVGVVLFWRLLRN
jgi:lipopolysaccharide export system permease protein